MRDLAVDGVPGFGRGHLLTLVYEDGGDCVEGNEEYKNEYRDKALVHGFITWGSLVTWDYSLMYLVLKSYVPSPPWTWTLMCVNSPSG